MAGTSRYKFNYIELLLLHLGMAFLIYIYEPIASLLLFGILAYFLFLIITKENRNNEALMAAAYIAGAEVFFRQTGGMVFYETGKYMVIVFLVIGMFFKGTSSRTIPYWTYLLILIPGIVVASMTISYQGEFRKLIAFNLSGPVALGVTALYCYYKKIKQEDFQRVISMLLLPIIAQMFYLYLYTPSMQDVSISLSGNYAATGGFGPNQISTVFGFGAFLIATRIFTIKHKLINIIDLVLLGMMGYRALITFSRGGVFTAIVCIIAFIIILYYKKGAREQSRLNFKIILLGGATLLIWLFSMVQTGGLLGNRYSNKDAAGQLKDDITTGRVELVTTELHAFVNYPITGIGVGKGREYREENLGIEINTHNEISRMLSEHGLLGMVALFILLLMPIIFWTKFKNNYYFLAFLAFWFLTINHSAMRIALPAFVYGLALLYIVDEKKDPVHRKRLTR
ncbi:O-antigen ligase family protein [Salegentibacter flavus]|uniref:O-antigen ligase like membrane protein n=1 Tax=Salegentibacter flavus TaxID=287099 RepID=A0A1I4Y5I8_9FLAO|nr:O-antigen ligase family protein [Salegentibacter flavus]SFN33348.1 O-antigen ligase like membrane protein [Salegentibacter flavus]